MSDYSEDGKSRKEFKKRTVKSKAQLEALEQFYDEHKYINESMKEELAKSTGLSEKQVAGWFCHRRLKDKKSGYMELKETGRPGRSNGTPGRSNGTPHDLGSGLKQDSCGSTKQEKERAPDLREAESKRSTYHESSAADTNYELGSPHMEMAKHSSPEDTSSGSGSSFRNMPLSQQRNNFTVAGSRNRAHMPVEMTEFRPRPGPSGYLKVKGHIENAAITAVKRNLGRNYRADGPPLGVEFDSIPPGPFGSHVTATAGVNGGPSYYAEEPVYNHSPEVSLGLRHHNSAPGYRFDSRISPHNSEIDGSRFKRARGSDHPDSYYQHDIYQARGSTNIHEGSAKRARGYESWDVDQKASRWSSDHVSGHNPSHLYDAKVSGKQPNPLHTMRSRVSASDHSSGLHLTSERLISEDSRAFGPPRRIAKESILPAEGPAVDENIGRVQAAKRVKGEHLEDYGLKKPYRNEMITAAKVETLEGYGSSKPYRSEMLTAADRAMGEHREDYAMKKPFQNDMSGRAPRAGAEVSSALKEDAGDSADDYEEEEEDGDDDDTDETSSDN